MKKLLSLVLTLALAAGLAVPAMAAADDVPVITVQPQNVAVQPGEAFTLSVEANVPNGERVGYQWYYHNTTSTGAAWSAATYNSTVGADGRGYGLYYCTVYNYDRGKSETSLNSGLCVVSQGSLSEDETPVIGRQPVSISTGEGMTFSLSLEAEIPNEDTVGYQWYQWRYGGVVQQGEVTQSAYTAVSRGGGTYFCVVYNADKGLHAGSVVSAVVRVTQRPLTAREQLELLRNNRPSLREGLKSDPLFLINDAIETVSTYLMVGILWLLDLLGVPPDRQDSMGGDMFQRIAMVSVIPLLAIYVLVFALPVSLIMLPFRGLL